MEKNKKATPREEIFTCRHCGNKTSHLLIYFHSIDVPLGIYHGHDEILAYYYVILFECKTCKGVSLKHVFSEELDIDGKIPYERIDYLYPVSKSFDEEIPKGLGLLMKEADKVKFISSMAYLILVRKVLEELCKERGIKEKNLQESIIKLVEQEKLPDVFSNASDKLRLLGNISAHESKIIINKGDIELIEEFLIALIEYIYIMPSKLTKLNDALERQKKIHKKEELEK